MVKNEHKNMSWHGFLPVSYGTILLNRFAEKYGY